MGIHKVKVEVTKQVSVGEYVSTRTETEIDPKTGRPKISLDMKSHTIETINDEYQRLYGEYQTLISPIRQVEKTDEPFFGGMPVQLEQNCTNELYRTNNGMFPYHVTLKVDGERYLLFMDSKGVLYLIDREVNFYYFSNDTRTLLGRKRVKPFLFDGELVTFAGGKYEYLIFDSMFYTFENDSNPYYYGNEFYQNRMTTANDFLNVIKDYVLREYSGLLTISIKKWWPIDIMISEKDIHRYVLSETNKNRNNKLVDDGLIFQPFDKPYVPFRAWNSYQNVQFKWKPEKQLSIDFKYDGNLLLTSTDQQFMVKPLTEKDAYPATLVFSDIDKKIAKTASINKTIDLSKYSETNPVILECVIDPGNNKNWNMFLVYRVRTEKTKANSLQTMMSVMNAIMNPVSLKDIAENLQSIDTKDPTNFIKSKLAVMSVSKRAYIAMKAPETTYFEFDKEIEIDDIRKLYNEYVNMVNDGNPMELEMRIFKSGKKGMDIDKFIYYQLRDFFLKSYPSIIETNYDLILNSRRVPDSEEFDSFMLANQIKKPKPPAYRSTYHSLNDVYTRRPIVNMAKTQVSVLTKQREDKKLKTPLLYRLALSEESPSNKIIGFKATDGSNLGNTIRKKERLTFFPNKFWKIDLTKVTTGNSIHQVETANEKYELELEYYSKEIQPFDEFIKGLSDLYVTILYNSSYC